MINIIYLGNDGRLKAAIGFLPNYEVRTATNYKQAEAICNNYPEGSHTILFVERHSKQEDITAISYLKKNVKGLYIILVSERLSREERNIYLQCGANDTISDAASVSDIHQKVSFVDEHEKQLFAHVEVQRTLFQFRIPLWKRLFDILFSLTAIILLSPIFIVTAIAIRLESPGKVWYTSKRVGANYKVFNFLKFRSMKVDADKHLKDFNNLNQYADEQDQDYPTMSEEEGSRKE